MECPEHIRFPSLPGVWGSSRSPLTVCPSTPSPATGLDPESLLETWRGRSGPGEVVGLSTNQSVGGSTGPAVCPDANHVASAWHSGTCHELCLEGGPQPPRCPPGGVGDSRKGAWHHPRLLPEQSTSFSSFGCHPTSLGDQTPVS